MSSTYRVLFSNLLKFHTTQDEELPSKFKESSSLMVQNMWGYHTYYTLNMSNKQRYHIVYQTSDVNQKKNPTISYINDSNNHQGGYRGRGRYNNNAPKRQTRCFICYKHGHLCTECPYDHNDINFVPHVEWAITP